jgi:hypothetical protein
MGLQDNFDTTLQHRQRYSPEYESYYNERQQNPTSFYTWENNINESVKEE